MIKQWIAFLIIAFLIMAGSSSVMAMPLSAAPSGAEITIEYGEPTINSDGSVLKDLAKTTIYYNIGSGPVKAAYIPATINTGGGTIIHKIILPVSQVEEVTADLWATASDTTGNESEKSNIVRVVADMLPPSPPK